MLFKPDDDVMSDHFRNCSTGVRMLEEGKEKPKVILQREGFELRWLAWLI